MREGRRGLFWKRMVGNDAEEYDRSAPKMEWDTADHLYPCKFRSIFPTVGGKGNTIGFCGLRQMMVREVKDHTIGPSDCAMCEAPLRVEPKKRRK